MRLKYDQFYRTYGVRQYAQLMRPRLIPSDRLILPLSSILHFWPDNNAILGPDTQDSLLSDTGGRLFVEHVDALATVEGGPRHTVYNSAKLEREFRQRNRGFKPLRKDEALTINTKNILVSNYGLLSPLYRYIPSFKAEYFRWRNVANTVWQHAEELHQRFGMHQFIELKLPAVIPKLSEFQMMERGISQKALKTFSTTTEFNLMDLWLWLSEDRQRSSMAVLSHDTAQQINFIVRLKGYFFIINLGLLDSWRKDVESETEGGVVSGSALQRHFLRLLHGLRDLMSGVTQIDAVQETDEGEVVDIQAPADTAKPKVLEVEDDAPEVLAEAAESLLPDLDDLFLPEAITDIESPVVSFQTPEIKAPTAAAFSATGDEADITPPSTEERLTQAVAVQAGQLHDVGLMSGRAYQRAVADAETYKDLKDPYGSDRPLTDMLDVKAEELVLPDIASFPDNATVPDKSMLQSKLKVMQRSYLRNVMEKDVVSSVMAVQQQGVAVKDYQVETVRDAMNHYQVHTVTLKPVRGRQSTVRFRLPVVDDDGRFVSNGTTYRMRMQRADLPIRKVNPSRVALTSYYNKTFVDRSSRSTNDYSKWLTGTITERGFDVDDTSITDMRMSNVFDMSLQVPRIYSILAKRVVAFTAGEYRFYLNHADRAEHFQKTAQLDITQFETDYHVVVASYGKLAVTVDFNSTFYVHTEEGPEVIGTIHDVLGIDASKAPVEIAEMTVGNKTLPLGFVMGYQLGLSGLIDYLNVDVTRFRRGERTTLQADEYRLVFQDEVLVFSRLDHRAAMILAGLNRYHTTLKEYSVWDFDNRDVYFQVLDDNGLGVRYLREIESLYASWVDPITRSLLEEMGEPTEFQPLLMRAAELLQTDYSPEEVDGAYMRYRGYERFAGMVYNELTRAAKTFNAKAGVGENAVEMNPHTVWQKVVGDPAVAPVEESNPFANIREQEVMTYRGDGGRGGKSMVERTRKYHQSDVGVVSESTVDSGDVGVVAYLSPDANFTSLRGTTRPYDAERDGPGRLLSSSALNAPCVDHDDAKRINFVAIQQQQGVFANGYEPTPLRTGYEQVIAQRTTDLFAASSEQDGQVTELTEEAITVTYKDGTDTRVQLGKRYGKASGVTYPHEIVTDLAVGKKVKAGDIIAYNRKFFQPDIFNPTQVVWKAGVMCTTALIDDIDTLEDGSVISQAVAEKFTTQTTEVRTIEVRFDQNVQGLVKKGDHVDLETILCTIEDPETAGNPLFDDAALDTLKRLSAMTPRAKLVGDVSQIEVFYHGEFEDMSESLQTLARASDRARKRQAKALGQPTFTGQVDTSFRIRGNALDPDTVAIQVYIDHDVPAGVGD